jgi:hypothetical protein
MGALSRTTYFSQWACIQRLSTGALLPAQLTLSFQLSELGLLRENLLAPLLHGGLHGGGVSNVGELREMFLVVECSATRTIFAS